MRSKPIILGLLLCLAGFSVLYHAQSGSGDDDTRPAANDPVSLEGVWSGVWGGGQNEGVTYLPVLAKMIIKGHQIEIYGFSCVDRLSGIARFDLKNRQMKVASSGDDQPKRYVNFTYKLEEDGLTLIDGNNYPIHLTRTPTVRDPIGNANVELVEATGIDSEGRLLINEYTSLRAGRIATPFYQQTSRSIEISPSDIMVVEEEGLKKISLEDARERIDKPLPVVIAYKNNAAGEGEEPKDAWAEGWPLDATGNVVQKTFARTLRPGTLVFVVARKNEVVLP